MLPFRAGLSVDSPRWTAVRCQHPRQVSAHILSCSRRAFAVITHLRDRLPRGRHRGACHHRPAREPRALSDFLVHPNLGGSPSPAAAWPRLIADLVCSQVFLALIAPWFFALQHRALSCSPAWKRRGPRLNALCRSQFHRPWPLTTSISRIARAASSNPTRATTGGVIFFLFCDGGAAARARRWPRPTSRSSAAARTTMPRKCRTSAASSCPAPRGNILDREGKVPRRQSPAVRRPCSISTN